MAGPEFKELQGHVRKLYIVKSSGLRWPHRIHDIMLQLGFKHCNPGLCVLLSEMKTEYGYIALYMLIIYQ